MLVLLNFSSHDARADVGEMVSRSTMLLSNYSDAPIVNGTTVILRPYQAVVYRVGK
jgi:hypothetical protein